MSSYPPKKNAAWVTYISLPDAGDPLKMMANPTLATGDVKVAIDDGAPANIGTLPVVDADFTKRVKLSLSQSEMNGDAITVIFSDQTDPPEWADVSVTFHTSARQIDDLATTSALATVDSNVDAILVDTAVIGAAGAGLTAVPWNSAWDAEVQSEVTDALNAYDPPTKAELDAAVSPLATSAALATVDGNVDSILEDTGTTLPSSLATILGHIDTEVAAILQDTGTTLPATLAAIASYIDTEVAAIKAVTDNLPDSGALSSLATASALTTVDGVVDAIKVVTDALPDSGALTSLATASALQTVDDEIATLDGIADAIKAKTDDLTFTVSGVLDANITYVNETEIGGDGGTGTEFGPV